MCLFKPSAQRLLGKQAPILSGGISLFSLFLAACTCETPPMFLHSRCLCVDKLTNGTHECAAAWGSHSISQVHHLCSGNSSPGEIPAAPHPALGMLPEASRHQLAALQSRPPRSMFPEGCSLTGTCPQADLASVPEVLLPWGAPGCAGMAANPIL